MESRVAEDGEHIEVEEGVAVGVWRGKFVGKAAVGEDLGAGGWWSGSDGGGR